MESLSNFPISMSGVSFPGKVEFSSPDKVQKISELVLAVLENSPQVEGLVAAPPSPSLSKTCSPLQFLNLVQRSPQPVNTVPLSEPLTTTTTASSAPSEKISPTSKQSPRGIVSWHPVVNEDGEIDISPSVNASKKLDFDEVGGVIYRLKHKLSKRRYIGSVLTTKTNTIFHRFRNYNRRINSDMKKMHIENAVARSPKKFNISVVEVKETITEDELHKLEEKWQDEYSTRDRKYGYNHSRPTQEPKRAGPRVKDPTKPDSVKMKKTKPAATRKNPTRTAADTAKAKIKQFAS